MSIEPLPKDLRCNHNPASPDATPKAIEGAGVRLECPICQPSSNQHTDLVSSLRQNATSEDCLNDPWPELLIQAADEIERLGDFADSLQRTLASDKQEIERLRSHVRTDNSETLTNALAEIERLQRESEWHAGNTDMNQKLLRENDRLRAALNRIVGCGLIDSDTLKGIASEALAGVADETTACPHCVDGAEHTLEHEGKP